MITRSFSVIIPTRDRPSKLALCLGSLAKLRYPRDCYEVVVVDDGGTVDLNEVIARFGNTMRVSCIRAAHGGPAAARNAGVAASTGQLIAFTDDDCRADGEWLRNLASRLDGAENALVGGRVVNELGANRYSRASQELQDFLYRWYHEERGGDLRFFTTNNLALTRASFDRLSGFDETFTFASEDRDLSDRALTSGLDLVYAPEAIVHHAHDLRFTDFLRQHYRYGEGAAHFHNRRRERRGDRVRLEPPAFYAGMLASPFFSGSPEPVIGSLLLLASQSALLAGAVMGAAARALGASRS